MGCLLSKSEGKAAGASQHGDTASSAKRSNESCSVGTAATDDLVSTFLSSISLCHYEEAFRRAGYDDRSVLVNISEKDIADIEAFAGITLPPGHKKRIILAGERLGRESSGEVGDGGYSVAASDAGGSCPATPAASSTSRSFLTTASLQETLKLGQPDPLSPGSLPASPAPPTASAKKKKKDKKSDAASRSNTAASDTTSVSNLLFLGHSGPSSAASESATATHLNLQVAARGSAGDARDASIGPSGSTHTTSSAFRTAKTFQDTSDYGFEEDSSRRTTFSSIDGMPSEGDGGGASVGLREGAGETTTAATTSGREGADAMAPDNRPQGLMPPGPALARSDEAKAEDEGEGGPAPAPAPTASRGERRKDEKEDAYHLSPLPKKAAALEPLKSPSQSPGVNLVLAAGYKEVMDSTSLPSPSHSPGVNLVLGAGYKEAMDQMNEIEASLKRKVRKLSGKVAQGESSSHPFPSPPNAKRKDVRRRLLIEDSVRVAELNVKRKVADIIDTYHGQNSRVLSSP